MTSSCCRCNSWVPDILIPGGCFTNVTRALQNFLSKFVYCGNSTCYANFKVKLCSCTQSHALGTHTKFQLKIITINVISGIVYFREIILESLRNVSETTPDFQVSCRDMTPWQGTGILVPAMTVVWHPGLFLHEPLLQCIHNQCIIWCVFFLADGAHLGAHAGWPFGRPRAHREKLHVQNTQCFHR